MRPATLRAEIREAIAVIAPLDRAEAAARDSALAWIDSGAPPSHDLTASFTLLDPARRTVLQVAPPGTGAWTFPGAPVDAVVPAVTVVRQAGEELGLPFSLHPDFGDRPILITRNATRTTLWFVLSGTRTAAPAGDTPTRWVSLDDAPAWAQSSDTSSFIHKLVRRLDGQR